LSFISNFLIFQFLQISFFFPFHSINSHSLWSQSRFWPLSEICRPWTIMNILGRPQSLILVKENNVDTYTKFAFNAKEYNQVDRLCPGIDRFPNVPRKITEPQWEKNYFWLYTMQPFLSYILTTCFTLPQCSEKNSARQPIPNLSCFIFTFFQAGVHYYLNKNTCYKTRFHLLYDALVVFDYLESRHLPSPDKFVLASPTTNNSHSNISKFFPYMINIYLRVLRFAVVREPLPFQKGHINQLRWRQVFCQ
jgi:hypothetical protein